MTQTKRAEELARPALAQGSGKHRNFLSDIVIDYGPRETLSRLFLKADSEFREMGIELSFAPAESLIDLNKANLDSWRALLPVFDAKVGGFNDDNGFVLLGRNRDGEIVLSQAQRLYSFTNSNLKEEVESMRLFYADPARWQAERGETWRITCPTAEKMTGRVVFNGAVWYRPDYRKMGLMKIIGRVAKGYGFTKWYTDYTISIMMEDVFRGGNAAKGGYPHHEWEVRMQNTPFGSGRAALIWVKAEEMVPYIEPYLVKPHTEVDAVIEKRTA